MITREQVNALSEAMSNDQNSLFAHDIEAARFWAPRTIRALNDAGWLLIQDGEMYARGAEILGKRIHAAAFYGSHELSDCKCIRLAYHVLGDNGRFLIEE